MNNKISLYIHIPFCKQKCLYCDFPSYCGKEDLMVRYVKAISKELERLQYTQIKTIFIGGGTPTYLSLEALNVLSDSLSKLNLSSDIEFTIEGNPGTFTKDKLIIFKRMGVNRLSIGLQAAQDSLLRKIGRIHSFQEFLDSFNLARNVGFNNINIDLMFGLPNQTLENWIETLEEVLKLNPEHISCYSLIVEEGTPFYGMYNDGKIELPNEDIERKMYYETLKILNERGYLQYEISNYSKIGKECKHNLVYWNLEEYIGVGSGAHSYIGGKRFSNPVIIEEYIESVENNKFTKINAHKNSFEDEVEEFLFMGLRKIEGISLKKFEEKFKKNIYLIYGDIIDKNRKRDLLEIVEGSLRLTKKGIELSNEVMSDFILTV